MKLKNSSGIGRVAPHKERTDDDTQHVRQTLRSRAQHSTLTRALHEMILPPDPLALRPIPWLTRSRLILALTCHTATAGGSHQTAVIHCSPNRLQPLMPPPTRDERDNDGPAEAPCLAFSVMDSRANFNARPRAIATICSGSL